MSPFAPTFGDDRKLAFAGAVALHASFAALFLFLARPPSSLPAGSVVPIEIVSSAPASAPAAAPPAPVAIPSVEPTPIPAPPAKTSPPKPAPAPAPAPAKTAAPLSTPAPSAQHARPSRPFSLDALAASIAKAAHGGAAAPPAAPRRPAPAAVTAPAGASAASVSASDMEGLQQLLERLWNPDCSVAGADSIVVPVKFTVGPTGRLIGRVTTARLQGSDPVAFAAARRAIDAVHEAEPFAPPYRDQPITVVFDAKTACSQP